MKYLLFLLIIPAYGFDDFNTLYSSNYNYFCSVIRRIESGNNEKAIGDNGKSIGAYQIQYAYWLDAKDKANKLKPEWSNNQYKDCFNGEYSKAIVYCYLQRYCGKALTNNHLEIMARVHNGGPKGYLKNGTLVYWEKFARISLDDRRKMR